MRVRFDDRLYQADRRFHALGLSFTYAAWITWIAVGLFTLAVLHHAMPFLVALLVSAGVGLLGALLVMWRVDHERPAHTYAVAIWCEVAGWVEAWADRDQSCEMRMPRRRRM